MIKENPTLVSAPYHIRTTLERPTSNLRYLQKKGDASTIYYPRLQQQFMVEVRDSMGSTVSVEWEWRDVPTVTEEQAANEPL